VEDLINLCAQTAANRKHYDRLRRHLLSSLVCLGSHTVTRHIATAGRQFVDWSADYRFYSKGRLNDSELFTPVRQRIIRQQSPDNPVVVALDDTRLKKSSRNTPGVKYVRDPLGPPFQVNLILAQRFLQISMAWYDQEDGVRMIPVDFVHAPYLKKPKKSAPESDWQSYYQSCRKYTAGCVGQQRLKELRQALDTDGAKKRKLVCVVDGGYTNRTFLESLPERTHVIGRIRGDAKLYHLPEGQKQRGRRCIYGSQAPKPEELLKDQSVPWQEVRAFACGKEHLFRVKSLSPVRWRATGENFDLRLVVIAPLSYRLRKSSYHNYRQPSYLICTDPQASLEDIIQHYIWRWDIEVNFRDEKTILGVGQAQVHHPDSVESVPVLSVAAYAILLCSASSLYGLNGQGLRLPPPKWQQESSSRISTQDIISNLRNELWGEAINLSHFVSKTDHSTKSHNMDSSLSSALFYGASRA
jgi:DDE superfamily endonuclease